MGRNKYERWLLNCVLIDGKTTLWCARAIQADPEEVRKDFEELLSRKRVSKRIRNRFTLPPARE